MSVGVLVDAITVGSVYALIALGFTIIFAPTRVVNFAQGEMFILGAAVMFQVTAVWGWPLWSAFAVLLPVMVAMGVLQERMIMVPVRRSGTRYAWIIATLAGALIFQNVFVQYFIPITSLKTEPFLTGSFSLFGTDVSYQKVLLVVGALAVMLVYDQFSKRTLYGKAIRAAAHDADTASLMGIGVRWVVLVSFVISALITGFAGFLTAPVLIVEPGFGLVFTVKGFGAAVIGGVGSAQGALLGGLIVGLLDAVVANQVSPSLSNMLVIGLTILLLLTFPKGILGREAVDH
jgi:branched-chain amino acid transport system permease protein